MLQMLLRAASTQQSQVVLPSAHAQCASAHARSHAPHPDVSAALQVISSRPESSRPISTAGQRGACLALL